MSLAVGTWGYTPHTPETPVFVELLHGGVYEAEFIEQCQTTPKVLSRSPVFKKTDFSPLVIYTSINARAARTWL